MRNVPSRRTVSASQTRGATRRRSSPVGHSARALGLERWKEPEVTDWGTFYSDHPECVVTDERIQELDPWIRRRAQRLAYGEADTQKDVEAEIRLGIVESAKSFRRLDSSGAPVFDYLAQANSYIVQHASGRAFSSLRRERTARLALRPLPIDVRDAALDADDELVPGTIVLRDDCEGEARELLGQILARLGPAEVRVFRLLLAGYEQGDIAGLLPVCWDTVHRQVRSIQKVVRALLDGEAEMDTTRRRPAEWRDGEPRSRQVIANGPVRPRFESGDGPPSASRGAPASPTPLDGDHAVVPRTYPKCPEVWTRRSRRTCRRNSDDVKEFG